MRHFFVVCLLVSLALPTPDVGAQASPAVDAPALGVENDAVIATSDTSPAAAAAAAASVQPTVAATAWIEALQSQFPVSPEQVTELRKKDTDLTQAAMSRATPAQARSDVIQVSLEPGATSPVIELLHGFATSIEVLDATGQPWPVALPTIGDSEAFSVQVVGAGLAQEVAQTEGVVSPAAIGSVITLAPLRKFAATNLIIVLQNQSRPISLILKAVEATPTTEFRDRVTISVQGTGPYARAVSSRGYEHLDAGEDLRSVLIGRAPRASATEILSDLPTGMRAWRDGATLWVRTQETLISPAHEASVAGGEHRAYRLRYLPVIVMSRAGELREINLQEAAL